MAISSVSSRCRRRASLWRSSPDRPPDFANAVHLLQPLAGIAREGVEGISVFIVLQILQALANLRKGYGTAEINPIDGREGSDHGKHDQQLPNFDDQHLVQERLHIILLRAAWSWRSQ